MSALNPSRNLAARMARWSAHHRKKAIFGWLALVIALFAIGAAPFSPIATKQIVADTSGPGESGQADKILYQDFKQPRGESVLIQNSEQNASSPALKAVGKSVIDRITPLSAVAKVESPFTADGTGLISDDKHSVLVPVDIRGPSVHAVTTVF